MKRLASRFKSKLKSEKAENTITMMIAFPLLWAIIMTVLDFGIFMQNRTMLVSDLREGARTVAIFGGSNKSNALIAAYGTQCSNGNYGTYSYSGNKSTGTWTADEDFVGCLVKHQIANNRGYSQIVISDVQCGIQDKADPTKVLPKGNVKIGDAVSCKAHYKYQGFPGSALGLMGGNFMMGNGGQGGPEGSIEQANAEIQKSGWNEGDVIVSAQSEVTMNNYARPPR